jgi:hypothetical protein
MYKKSKKCLIKKKVLSYSLHRIDLFAKIRQTPQLLVRSIGRNGKRLVFEFSNESVTNQYFSMRENVYEYIQAMDIETYRSILHIISPSIWDYETALRQQHTTPHTLCA